MIIAGLAGYLINDRFSDKGNNNTTSSSQSSDSTQDTNKDTETPAPDPYAGWKTYENSLYGITFKYPAELTVDDTFIHYNSEGNYNISLKNSTVCPLFTLNYNIPRGCVAPAPDAPVPPAPIVSHIGKHCMTLAYDCATGGFVTHVNLGSTKVRLEVASDYAAHKDTLDKVFASFTNTTPISE